MKIIITTILLLFAISLLAQDSITSRWVKSKNQSELNDTSWRMKEWRSMSAGEPEIKIDSVKIQYKSIDGIIYHRQRFYYYK